MKIFVTAKPRAKEEKVERIDETHYIVSVKEPPRQGEANRAIIKILAKYLKVAPARMKIVRGQTGRQKIIEIA